MNNSKFDKLLVKYADVIARTGRELATNFDIPSRDIIAMACAEMGITPKQWDALQSYRIAKKEENG